jgi:ABC-type glycerol-3-phosphate transport system substrate-binding protein
LHWKKFGRCRLLLIALLTLAVGSSGTPISGVKASSLNESSLSGGEAAAEDPFNSGLARTVKRLQNQEPYYQAVLEAWLADGAKPGTAEVAVNAADTSRVSDETAVRAGAYRGKDGVLIWTNRGESWIEYEVDVPASGLYNLELSYHPYMSEADDRYEDRSEAALDVLLDGAYLFREAKGIPFYRAFRDAFPLKQNEYGDDIRPQSMQLEGWMTSAFYDAGGAYSEPLQWYMEAGTHTLRLATSDSIVIESLRIVPPKALPAYADAAEARPAHEPAADGAAVIEIEAEQAARKNTISLQISASKDPAMTPQRTGHRVLNALGGNGWRLGGQEATWSFQVEQAGWYKIALRARQNFAPDQSVFRTIRIDGEVPFRELLEYRFPYAADWGGVVLADERGEPFEFYFEPGEHTISMRATYAPFQPVLVDLDAAIGNLNVVAQEIFSLTGGVVDQYRTWRVKQDYPELLEQLAVIRDQLLELERRTIEINGKRNSAATVLGTAAAEIQSMLNEPNGIPNRMDQINTIQSSIGSVRTLLNVVPLQLDKLYVLPADAKLPRMKASFWAKLVSNVQNFFYSFTRADQLASGEEGVLQVWARFGRDYVDLLQEMADQYYTPVSGIKVKVNLLQNEQVLVLANAAGKQPDAVLGLSEGQPVSYGLRGAAVDLSMFPDFGEVAANYAPGALLPYYYDGQYFGLPETQHFQMMFYRKDILEKLGLEVPRTWEDVYEMLPTLVQNHYDFFIPQSIYLAMFYQYGAEFYDEHGLGSALNTPEAYETFRRYTDLYSIYGVPQQVTSFYQHFRDGDIPIGFSDFNTYIELSVAAPELTGWWGMAPLPGVEREDGTIVRWSGGNAGALAEGLGGQGGTSDSGTGGQTAVMIYENSKMKEEAWDFIKWWLDADTQVQFGSTLESFYGIAFRWNTANVHAFVRLPWERDELNAILEQWRWYKALPNIPGSYFIPREIQNAWNRTVLDGQNYRTSLQEAQRNIDREIYRKQIEFKVRDEAGNVLKTLDPPRIDTPWDGVNAYVGG